MNAFSEMVHRPTYLGQASSSPFFQTEDIDGFSVGDQSFTQEVRKVKEPENFEDYYNEWIMSNYG